MEDNKAKLEDLLKLLYAPGLGPKRIRQCIKEYGSGANFWQSSIIDRQKRLGWTTKALNNLDDYYKNKHYESPLARDLNWLESSNEHHIIPMTSPDYPDSLEKSNTLAPVILYVKGRPEVLISPQIAMVGSRKASSLSRSIAKQWSYELSVQGFVITSGLALGIDGQSHSGAIEAEQPTIAVLAHGLDRVYPACHRRLADSILAFGGALVSEFPIGTPIHANYFPRRNRVISGLSLGCVVIEAAIASGSLITAQYALEAGREVLVVPGPINYPGSKGCHKLIKDGAHLVETAEEVAYVLGGTVNLAQKETRLSSHRMLANSDPDLNIVLSSICYDITPMDVIIKMCELPMSRIMSLLMELEAAGYITSVPGGYKKHMGVPNERNCA